MKTLFSINGAPYGNERPYNAFPHALNLVKREIESTDKTKDKLIYESYWLTKEDVKIVKGR